MSAGATLQAAASSIDLANLISITGTDTFATSNNTLELDGTISGTGAISDLTGGTLILTGANTYSGVTTIGGGAVLQIQGVSALGAADGTLTLGSAVNTGTLRFRGGNDAVRVPLRRADRRRRRVRKRFTNASEIDGVISGSGSLTDASSGLLILTGANTYTGGTSIFFGTLQVANDLALGSGPISMATVTTLQAGAATVSLSNAVGLTGFDTIDNNGNALTLSGVISGVGSLTEIGAGTLTLSGTNTYTGGTTIAGGTLLIDGSTASSAVTVGNGGTLSGTGSAGAVTVESGGTFAPGDPSTFTVAGLTLNSGATLDEEIGGAAPGTGGAGGYDQTVVESGGAISLGGAALDVSLVDGFAPSVGAAFTIINNETGNGISGTFGGSGAGRNARGRRSPAFSRSRL